MIPRLLSPLVISTAFCLAMVSSASLALAQGAPETGPAPEAEPAPETEPAPDAEPAPEVAAPSASRVLVVPIAVKSGNLGATAKQVTTALAAAATNSGAAVETSAASRAQVTDLSDCKNEAPECMQAMLDVVSADIIVLGSLVATEGGLILTVKQVTRGEPVRVDTHVLKGPDSPELEGQIDTIAATTFGATPPPIVIPDKVVPPPIKEPGTASTFSLSKVNTAAWVITGTGAGLAVAGAIMLAVASGKQSDVDSAPDATLDDINKLRDLEDSAERSELFGNSFLIAGAVTTAAGVTWAILQARRGTPSESPTMVLAPSPTEGGAMVNLTWFQ